MTTKSNMILIMIMSHVKHKLFRLRGRKVSTGIDAFKSGELDFEGPQTPNPNSLSPKPRLRCVATLTESHEPQKTMSQESKRHR